MTDSMTAFSRTEADMDGSQLIWEIRTVNHRYLDINLKLPEELRSLDTPCRQRINDALKRGRVDAHLKIEQSSSPATRTAIDSAMVTALVDMLAQISQAQPELRPAKTIDILRWPGVISENPVDPERLNETSLKTLDDGLSQLVTNRGREGSRRRRLGRRQQ